MTDSSVALRRAPGFAALIPDPSRLVLRLAFPIAPPERMQIGQWRSRIPETRLRNAEMADALHMVMDADGTPYARVIVNRLAFKDKVIKASQPFEDG